MELGSFHALYMLLGAISTPVETLSITTLYTACYFCLIALIAIVLKITNNPDYYELKKFMFASVSCLYSSSYPFYCKRGSFYRVATSTITSSWFRPIRIMEGSCPFLAAFFPPSVLVGLGSFGGTIDSSSASTIQQQLHHLMRIF